MLVAITATTIEPPPIPGAEPINLMSVDRETATDPGGDLFLLLIDSLVADFTVSLVGDDATIKLFGPGGKNYDTLNPRLTECLTSEMASKY